MVNPDSSAKLRHRMMLSRSVRLGRSYPRQGKSNNNADNPKDDRVRLLFDYTKFHIGVYISLASAVVAVLGLKKSYQIEVEAILLIVGVVNIMIAGLAGGTIVSRLTQVLSYDEFWEIKTGPGKAAWLTGEEWTYVEHASFWIGLICIFSAFVIPLIGV